MKYIKALFVVAIAVSISVAFNMRIGKLPPLGKFFDPHAGFWKNAELNGLVGPGDLSQLELMEKASLVYDKRGVPHIFASNNYDLYYLQGYLTAIDRLWQMEFQTHAAAGRLSEIIGEKAFYFDRDQRRIGMVTAAKAALQKLNEDADSKEAVQAYTAGVNAYIETIDRNNLPFEYRLLDYKPEPWTPLKCSLLLKYMAKMLTGTERDRENTALLELLGLEMFTKLYPEQNKLPDPVVEPPYIGAETDTSHWVDEVSFGPMPPNTNRPPKNLGSNNWAVAGNRTATGLPILANDPHLRLTLPSIWYEVQLHAPGINSYGVSLPGSPGITIGFNENIAWGVTNAGLDVKDYYRVEYRDSTKAEYKVGNNWETVESRVETIKIRGGLDKLDTVRMTKYGPVAFKEQGEELALWWTVHQPSNELKTFYQLNRAANLDDYNEALLSYNSPGQNFVYADNSNNIAIRQRGAFPIKKRNHGRFVLNASANYSLPEMIPFEDNPVMINPKRGFVSSANQAPTDTTYPFYYTGVFEEFRNRTINRVLEADSSVTAKDMMDLQNNNYNLLAAEVLPIMLELLDTTMFVNDSLENLALAMVKDWNYINEKGHIGPTVFQIWWDELNGLIYDEMNSKLYQQKDYYDHSWQEMAQTGKAYIDLKDSRYVYPMATVTINLLKNEPDHIIFDHYSTKDKRENAKQLIYDSFYWTAIKFGDIIKYKLNEPHWGLYQDTRIRHMARIDALGTPNLFVSGNENAPNATTATHGPSWRMVVELGKDGPTAYGVFPGGQSGNPGSPNYLFSLDNWMNGDYYELKLLNSPDEVPRNIYRIDLAP